MFVVDGKQLPLESRGGIVALKNQQMSNVAIARAIGCSENTVRRWWKRYNENGHVKRQNGSGRPKKTTEQQDEALYQRIVENPFLTAARLSGNMLPTFILL